MSYYETKKEHTVEFSIFKVIDKFLVEQNGKELGMYKTLAAANKAIKEVLKKEDIQGAGVTEVFGRNRQFISTTRYAFKAYKEGE